MMRSPARSRWRRRRASRDVAHQRGRSPAAAAALHAGDLLVVRNARAVTPASAPPARPLRGGASTAARWETLAARIASRSSKGRSMSTSSIAAPSAAIAARAASPSASARHVPSEVDRDLRLGDHQVGAGERVARPGREHGRLREMADHRAVEASCFCVAGELRPIFHPTRFAPPATRLRQLAS